MLFNMMKLKILKRKEFFTSLIVICVLATVALASCSARIDGQVLEGGRAELTIVTALEPRTIALIQSVRRLMGAPDGPILDGAAISSSASRAPGVRAVALANAGPTALEGTISISNVGDFLAANDAQRRFITFSEGRTAGSSHLLVTLDRESAPDLIALLAPELTEYLTALMAPVILGEQSTRQEYLTLISLIYGRALADEITAARIRAGIDFPRPLTQASGATMLGNRAVFDIPLVDLLVMEPPLRYELRW
jgi:hypothetical protein